MKRLKRKLAMYLAVVLMMVSVLQVNAQEVLTAALQEETVVAASVSEPAISTPSISADTIYAETSVVADVPYANVLVSGLNGSLISSLNGMEKTYSGNAYAYKLLEDTDTSVVVKVGMKVNYSEGQVDSYLDFAEENKVVLRIHVLQYGMPYADNMKSQDVADEYTFDDGTKVKYYDATNVSETHSYVSGNDIEKVLDKKFYPADLMNLKSYDELGTSQKETKVKLHNNYVTIYDGKTTGTKKTAGKIVAVYNSATPDGFADIAGKVTYKLKSAISGYYQVNGMQKTFMGYQQCTVDRKGNATVTGDILKDLSEVGAKGAGCYVMVWDFAEPYAAITENYQQIVVAKGKSATVFIPGVFGTKAKVAAYKSGDGLLSAKYVKAKSAITVRVKKTAQVGAEYKFKMKNAKDGKEQEFVVKVVEPKDVVSAYSALELCATTGARTVALDKGEKSADTVQLVTLPGETGVKYFVSAVSNLDGNKGEMSKSAAKAMVKDDPASKKIVSIKAGKVKSKTAGEAYVYAYVMPKTTGSKVNLVISNPVRIQVGVTCATFKLSGGYKLTYTNENEGYQAKKDFWYKFAVKPSVKNSSDIIALRVLDTKGRVVLGGKNALTTRNSKGAVKENTYYITQKAGAEGKRVYEDSALVVATAPNGIQHWAKLMFVKK